MKKALLMLGALALTCSLTDAVANDYPNGCVSCHVKGETDFRLNVLLANIGHGRGGERTLEIPVGCNRCHATDGSGNAASISKLVHSVHYENPNENAFVTKYSGDCRNCHSMDAAAGYGSIKVGERNWELRIIRPQSDQSEQEN